MTAFPNRISPWSGVSRPATQRSKVVLPDPLGPSRTKNSVSPISTLASRSATTLPFPERNTFCKPRTPIMRTVPVSQAADAGVRDPASEHEVNGDEGQHDADHRQSQSGSDWRLGLP